MIRFKYCFALFSFIFSASAFSADVWSDFVEITEVKGIYHGGLLITTNPMPSPCSGFRFFIGENLVTADGAQLIDGLVMMAMTTDRNISVLYDDSTGSCYARQLKVQK